MVLLTQFWTPCYWYDNIKQAIYPLAFYTAMGSIIFITYTCYVMNGGESSQFYMPYFETDRDYSTQVAGGLAIFFFLLFFASSLIMIYGVKTEIRGFFIPWIIGMSCIILYQLVIGFHWLWAYYIYLENIFALICMWVWMAYNIYCCLAVYSYYQYIRDKQTPNILIDEYIPDDKMFYWDETV